MLIFYIYITLFEILDLGYGKSTIQTIHIPNIFTFTFSIISFWRGNPHFWIFQSDLAIFHVVEMLWTLSKAQIISKPPSNRSSQSRLTSLHLAGVWETFKEVLVWWALEAQLTFDVLVSLSESSTSREWPISWHLHSLSLESSWEKWAVDTAMSPSYRETSSGV